MADVEGGAAERSVPVGSGPEVLGVRAPDNDAAAILDYWFGELTPEEWFRRDAAVDAEVAQRFGMVAGRVATGMMPHWADSPGGVLAAVIALDQFPRNIYRDDPRAYATDDQALALAEHAIERGFDREMGVYAKQFLYMPLMHSEDPDDQARALDLFRTLGLPEAEVACEQHKRIVDRFGRFPHRNAILGRDSTAEEEAFLQEPNSSF